MPEEEKNAETTPFYIDTFRSEDAPGIVELFRAVYGDAYPIRLFYHLLWGESVCNHLISQKMALEFQVIETGLEIALMPGETYSKEQSSAGRIAALNSFRSYVSRPHHIYIPQVYENILKPIYNRLDDRRDLAVSGAQLPADLRTQIQMSVFARELLEFIRKDREECSGELKRR